jgi:hypothetical protein
VTFFLVIASPSALMKAIKFSGTISAVPRPGLRQNEFRRPRAMFVATFRWGIRSNAIVWFSLETLQSTYSCCDAAEKDDDWTFIESNHPFSFPQWSSLTKRRSSASKVRSLSVSKSACIVFVGLMSSLLGVRPEDEWRR